MINHRGDQIADDAETEKQLVPRDKADRNNIRN